MKYVMLILAVMISSKAFAADLSQNFSFDGYLLDASSNPITTSSSVKFQIYNPAGNCLLFEETHAAVVPGSDGYFSVKVGTGSRSSPGVDGGLVFKTIFQNDAQLRASSTTNCTPGYTPTSGDSRKLRVIVAGVTLSPDYVMGSVPMATVAETLQGKSPSDFMSVNPNYTFPGTDGTNGQVMTTNGAGVISWTTPGAGGITTLNGLSNSAQTFNTGTSGTSPSWSSGGAIHTFNIPMASTAAVTGGLISKTDYDSFNDRLPKSGGTMTGSLYLANHPSASMEPATKQYVDTAVAGASSPVDNLTIEYFSSVLQVKDGGITTSKLAAGSVTAAAIANNTIGDNQISSISVDKLSNGAGKYMTYAPNNINCSNNSLLKWDGANFRWDCGPNDAVSGTGGTMSGALMFGNYATAASPSIKLVNSGTGIYSPSSNEIGFSTGSSDRVRISASGNMGIGTTAPGERLEVSGNVKADGVLLTMGGAPGTGCAQAGLIGYNVGAQRLVHCDGSFWAFTGGAKSPDAGAGASAGFNTSNLVVISSPSGSISLNGMQNGGEYKVILQNATPSTYIFTSAACGTWKYKTPNANTTASSDTIYRIQVIGSTCYVDWSSGYM